jgi:cobalt-zinc-cadmium efflux system protein
LVEIVETNRANLTVRQVSTSSTSDDASSTSDRLGYVVDMTTHHHEDQEHAHGHGHHGHHGHSHHAHGEGASGALARAGGINLAWALAQAAAGIALGSTALLSDSVHNLGDAAGLILAWGAAVLAARQATSRRTWGWHRAELLAGFANAVLVLTGAAFVMVGAIWKLWNPVPLHGLAISAWAVGGIAVNALSAWWISGHGANLNARGAFLHLVSDALVSAAVVVGGLAVHFTGLSWIDPLLAMAIAVWLLRSTWPFLRETLDALLDAVPHGQDLSKIERDLASVDGVLAVHDLHLWPLGGERAALTAHLVHGTAASSSEVLRRALDTLHHRHPLVHATLQVEPEEVDSWHGHEVCPGREGLTPARPGSPSGS